jgi:predicted ArsR family transcriptional regulator
VRIRDLGAGFACGRQLRDTGVVKKALNPRDGRPAARVPVSASGSAPVAPQAVEASTRDRVARTVLENGPLTAAALAERLGLTTAAVRRHLDALLADTLIEERQPRNLGNRGRGRPARLFAMTAAGRDQFDQAYDDLAASALRFLAEHGGKDAVANFARQRVADLEARYRPVVEAAPADRRTQALAEALSGDGYAASTRTVPGLGRAGAGEQLCQHNCPVAHVAEQFPQLCEAETEVFARLLGTSVQRLATIAHGDGVCTTHISHVPAPTSRPTTRRTSR